MKLAQYAAGQAGALRPTPDSTGDDRRYDHVKQVDASLTIASPSACAGSSRARCCSTPSRAGATRRTRRTTRSSRSAWSCRRTDDDVRAAMAIAREEGVPLLPRGGGTSQSGQTVGRALVLDFSKHLNRLIEIDAIGAHLHRRARHRARRAEPAAQTDGPVVPGRRVDRQPRHHRRHDRQQLLRHALDPLRHHARQRASPSTRSWPTAARRGSARWGTICALRDSPHP